MHELQYCELTQTYSNLDFGSIRIVGIINWMYKPNMRSIEKRNNKICKKGRITEREYVTDYHMERSKYNIIHWSNEKFKNTSILGIRHDFSK